MKLKAIGLVVCFFLFLRKAHLLDNRNVQYYGFIGCMFSSAICRADENCIDDGLFGSCHRSGTSHQDLYWYQLSSEQLLELEKILHHLATYGYTWRHLYTQCRLMSTLLSYRYGIALSNDFCDRRPQSPERKTLELDLGRQGLSTDQLIEDLIEMLNAKISLSDKEDPLGVARHEKRKKNKPLSSQSNAVPDSDEASEKLLKRLSYKDLKMLKDFLIEQDEEPGYDSHDKEGVEVADLGTVKRVDHNGGGTITKVVIHLDEGPQEASEVEKPSRISEAASFDNSKLSKTSLSAAVQWTTTSVPGVIDHEGHIVGTNAPFVPLHRGVNEQSLPADISASSSADAEYNKTVAEEPQMTSVKDEDHNYLIPLYVLCGLLIVIIIAAVAVVMMRHKSHLKEKLALSAKNEDRKSETRVITGDYQDLCREDMRQKLEEKKPCPAFATAVVEPSSATAGETSKTFHRSNAVTCPEDLGASQLDISTGHMILTYMEDHWKNKDKLDKDWNQLCSYDAEPGSIVAAIDPTNMRKNRYADILPYEHTRVHLNPLANVTSTDYINASTITDHDPRCPAYIAAQGPLAHTVSDFWQMVWEQGSTTIVCLTRLVENDVAVCCRYWPVDGSDLYHIYEVRFVSEHKTSDDYVVRSFCLRNIETNETRTVTQFHYLSWPSRGIPASVETIMDFRRKVNHSYHGRFCPVIVHCSDGAGQTGTYCLIDMVLNRLSKGAKEMDIAATLEHIRDQRVNMIRTKEQFEFCLLAIAYEVESILRSASAN